MLLKLANLKVFQGNLGPYLKGGAASRERRNKREKRWHDGGLCGKLREDYNPSKSESYIMLINHNFMNETFRTSNGSRIFNGILIWQHVKLFCIHTLPAADGDVVVVMATWEMRTVQLVQSRWLDICWTICDAIADGVDQIIEFQRHANAICTELLCFMIVFISPLW